MQTKLIERDLKHNWHPCSQMKDYQTFKPLIIKRSHGPYIELQDGKKIIDAISSWWCKSLGHNHPVLKSALISQLEQFEHVIFANTTHENIVNLSEKLASLTDTLDKVFYASDGSCAVEIALKMSIHSRQITGEIHRNQFMALENGYHGETGLALSVSDLGIYRKPYESLLMPCHFLKGIPYVESKDDPLWHDCSEQWPAIEKQLQQHADSLTALIVEPIAQGAGGMLIYSADFLYRLRKWTKAHNIHLIADEIMTGIYRTGLPLACQHANIEPDFLCLGKGLTSGFLPLSAMLTSTDIYNLFYDDYEREKSFLHSHTHSGNALATSIASACLTVMEDENIKEKVQQLEIQMCRLMRETIEITQSVRNFRYLGGITAVDLINPDNVPRLGYTVYQEAINLGAFLRPLGNTLYWLPPLNTEKEVIADLARITQTAINNVMGQSI